MFLNRHRLDYWVLANAGSVPFTPTSLFAASETGGWWDPADHTTTWQDVPGTVPATAAGDNVSRIDDKSGNGNNLVLTGSNAFPVLRNSGALWWIEFRGLTNGTVCFLQKTFTLVQPHTRINAAANITWSANGALFDGGSVNTAKFVGITATPTMVSFALNIALETNDLSVGVNHVISEFYSGASSTLKIDNGIAATGDPGAANPGGFTVGGNGNSGEQGSDVDWFGGVNIGRALTAPEATNCRTFFGNLAGLSL